MMFEKNSPYLANLKDLFVKPKPYKVVLVPVETSDNERGFGRCVMRETVRRFSEQKKMADYLQQFQEPERKIQLPMDSLGIIKDNYYPIIIEQKDQYNTVVGMNIMPKSKDFNYKL